MATQERLLDIDAVSELIRQPEYADKRFYMIDGENDRDVTRATRS